MDFSQIGRRVGQNDDPKVQTQLNFLLQTSQAWNKLDQQIKQFIPHNLHAHLRIACIQQNTLTIFANNQMALSRLRMLVPIILPKVQSICADVQEIKIKMSPKQEQEKQKRIALSPTAAQNLLNAAQQVHHHPDLSQALTQLAQKASSK